MKDKKGPGRHQQAGGQPGQQQQRNQSTQADRRQEGGHLGGERQRQPGQSSNMEREKAQKGKGSPA